MTGAKSSERSRVKVFGLLVLACAGLSHASGCARPITPAPEPVRATVESEGEPDVERRSDAGTAPSDAGPAPSDASTREDLGGADASSTAGATARVCSSDHWCWYNPLPFGVRLNTVWVTDGGSVWAAGRGGVIWRWNGTSFETVPSGTDQTLTELWGSGEASLWAVGEGGTILHWDGTSWSPVASGTTRTLHGAWGTAENDLWAVGEGGTILRWDGASWAAVPSGTSDDLHAVWASSSGEAWAVGYGGLILRWNGTAWRRVGSPARLGLRSVSGFGPNDVWVGGNNADVLHWNGGAWSHRGFAHSVFVTGIWGDRPDDVWVTLENNVVGHWDGRRMTRSGAFNDSFGGELYDIHGNASGDVWIVGANSGSWVRDGTSWRRASSLSDVWLGAISGYGADDVWVLTSEGPTLHWDGAVWTPAQHPLIDQTAARSAWSFEPEGMWVVHSTETEPYTTRVRRWDGTRVREWTARLPELAYERMSEEPQQVFAAWGHGPDVLYALQIFPGALLRWTGRSWAVVSEENFDLIGGTGPDDVWAVDVEFALHFDGRSWSRVPLPPAASDPGCSSGQRYLSGLWSTGPDDVWIVGHCNYASLALHWDGRAWSAVDVGDRHALRGVWASGPNDVWAVGDQGTILHWDGTSWTRAQSGTSETVAAIWGSGPGDIWAVGARGTILRHQP